MNPRLQHTCGVQDDRFGCLACVVEGVSKPLSQAAGYPPPITPSYPPLPLITEEHINAINAINEFSGTIKDPCIIRGHAPGRWQILTPTSQARRCTECGFVVATAAIPRVAP